MLPPKNLELDVKNLACPLPLLKAKVALKSLEVGDTLEVWSTDAGSYHDFEIYIAQTDHELLIKERRGECYYFKICRG